MKKHYNVLVLTDHGGHSDQNSVYALLQTMLKHEQCRQIQIASRGLEVNQEFFQEMKIDTLQAAIVKSDFAHTSDGYYMQRDLKVVIPSEIDIVFMRLPRPISDEFLTWVDDSFQHCSIVNKPSGIIETSSKSFLLNFPEQCPSMKLCQSIEDVLASAKSMSIVLKPLKEYGGKGILKIDGDKLDDGQQIHDTKTFLKTIEKQLKEDGYLSMKFLKNVTKGDKRILVVGGEIMASSLRIPAEGSWLCNVAQGGSSVPSEVTAEEEKMIEAISPMLTERGIFIFGADTLMDDDGTRILSEVNTLSIGGFMQAEKQTNKPILLNTINNFFRYADARTR